MASVFSVVPVLERNAFCVRIEHCGDVIMGTISSQITNLTIVYSTVYSGADKKKHQSSASLAFVRGIDRRPVNSPHKRSATRKMFPFGDVIVKRLNYDDDLVSFQSIESRFSPFVQFISYIYLLHSHNHNHNKNGNCGIWFDDLFVYLFIYDSSFTFYPFIC